MPLKISLGQHSDRGPKPLNQDFHGAWIPDGPQLDSKGVALAVADGISSSDVSHVASQFAVTAFLEDYYCTSDAWSVKTSVERVVAATNAWLFSQTQQGQGRYDKDRGHVCTWSALVLKSTTAHVFHVGDSRIYQVHANALEQLTRDHRVQVSSSQSYLGRALGIDPRVEVDYRSLPLERGDLFLLTTDGVHEHVAPDFILATLRAQAADLDRAARLIVEEALRRGSDDNLTIQIVRIDELPSPEAHEIQRQLSVLPIPPILEARQELDGYRILREVHGSSRSHIYLALDTETDAAVILKIPSIDLREDPAYLERFLMEEWVARRIDSPHVLKPCPPTRRRNWLYVVTEFIEGRTLAQWMIDHPKPDVATVRSIVGQIAKGLRAFHRQEMLHQDLRPENVMIDRSGTVKIIDFGSTRVAGMMEIGSPTERSQLLGTVQYTAPEYFLGEPGTPGSDLFSLGVIAHQMLTGTLPYGAEVARIRTPADRMKLGCGSVRDTRPDVPVWIDEAIRRAVHPLPHKRYAELSEFVHDLHHPNPGFLRRTRAPLIERNPVVFWKTVSLLLGLVLLTMLAAR